MPKPTTQPPKSRPTYLLDTDTASLALRRHLRIGARILQTPAPLIWLGSIAAEEMIQGALASVNQARSRPGSDIETVSRYFVTLLIQIAKYQLLPYTNAAERLFQSWPASVKRIGPNDCRIAAGAIAHGYTVVTCNGKDFSRIPGVRFEDWSA